MDDLNQKKSSTTSIIAAIIVALLLGFGAYTYTKQKMQPTAPATAPTETAKVEETTPPPAATTPAAPTEAEKGVLVETKKLPIAEPETPAPSAASTDPKIVAMMAPRTLGEASAPVKITEYSSLTCPHCGAFHRESFAKFKSEFIDTGKVQMTFKEFPLNQPAMDASQILRCMPEDKYVSFMNLLFQEQDKWAYSPTYKDFLKQNAKLAGMSDETYNSCLANNALKEAIIGDMKAAGDKYKVQSTPSFVINHDANNVLVGNQPIQAFEKAINLASGGPAPASTGPAPVAPRPEPAPEAAAASAVKATGAEPAAKDSSSDEDAPPAE